MTTAENCGWQHVRKKISENKSDIYLSEGFVTVWQLVHALSRQDCRGLV